MTTEARYKVQLCMRRNLINVPDINIPAGYELRHYQPGDGKAWEDIINSAFDRDNMNFYNFMNLDNSYRDDRVLFICKDIKPVATAAAWYKPEWGKNTGYLHMVGTHPNHTSNRLGYWVSLAAMHKMKEEGREDVILLTDDFRIPAYENIPESRVRTCPYT